MAVTTFKAERLNRGPNGISRYHNIWLDGHEIGRFVTGFEIVESIGKAPTLKLEILAHVTITEIEEPKTEDELDDSIFDEAYMEAMELKKELP